MLNGSERLNKNLSEADKKRIAGRQFFRCNNKPGSILYGLENYECPLWQRNTDYKGNFDGAGYDIDHIIERSIGGTNDEDNLQALCPTCHAYKTRNFRSKKNNSSSEEENINYDSDNENNKKKIIIDSYENFMKYTIISKIIITNKTKKLGFLKFHNRPWRRLYEKNDSEMEYLEDILLRNHTKDLIDDHNIVFFIRV